MKKITISSGVVHKTPKDLEKIILSKKDVLDIWEDITPL